MTLSYEEELVFEAKRMICINRRQFLFMGAVVLTDVIAFPDSQIAKEVLFRQAPHNSEMVALYSSLEIGKPQLFEYPKGSGVNNILVRLGKTAGNGIGPEQDLVAFHSVCTHMGGDLKRSTISPEGALGACPFHLSVFDLRRFGVVVTGHATSPLPQVQLKLKENQVFATGFTEILYGFETNPA